MIKLKEGFEYIIQTVEGKNIRKIKVLELTVTSCYIENTDSKNRYRCLLKDFNSWFTIIEDLTSDKVEKALKEFKKQPYSIIKNCSYNGECVHNKKLFEDHINTLEKDKIQNAGGWCMYVLQERGIDLPKRMFKY